MRETKASNKNISKYVSNRPGSNSWAQCKALIDAWRHGLWRDIKPKTLEYAPNLRCNQACSECPYRLARRAAFCARRVPRGEFVEPDDITASTLDTAKIVLNASAKVGVRGVLVTGGGEPCIWAPLPEMLVHSAQLGMFNGLYTNGINIGEHPELADCLLEPDKNLIFVRVSINAISQSVAARFSGASPEDVKAQIAGLAALLKARKRFVDEYEAIKQWVPSIQLSVIIDDRNVRDLINVCEVLADTVNKFSEGYHGRYDNFVVRPLTKHCRGEYGTDDHDDSVIRGILDACGEKGFARPIIQDAGMKLKLGFGLDLVDSGLVSSHGDIMREEYNQRDGYCYAIGLFLTVGPDATVHLCVDRNCDPKWALGNLKEQSVEEVYRSQKRLEILKLLHHHRCGPAVCEATCRTPRLNRIAKAIMAGELTDTDIEYIRQESLSSPPLLLS